MSQGNLGPRHIVYMLVSVTIHSRMLLNVDMMPSDWQAVACFDL